MRSTGARDPMVRTRGAESRRPLPEHRPVRSERPWRNCTCDRFLEPWVPLSWAGKPTSLSSRVDSNGTIADETTRGFLKAFIDQFAATVARVSFAREVAA